MQLQNEIVKKHTPIKSLLIDWLAIVRALKASQALGRAALTGRGGTPARLC